MDGIVTWHTVQYGGTMCSFSVNPVRGARVETPIPKLTVTDQPHGELYNVPFFTWMLVLWMVLRTDSVSIVAVEYLFSLFPGGNICLEKCCRPLWLSAFVLTPWLLVLPVPQVPVWQAYRAVCLLNNLCVHHYVLSAGENIQSYPFSLWIGRNICSTDFYEMLNMHSNSKECHLWSPVIRN